MFNFAVFFKLSNDTSITTLSITLFGIMTFYKMSNVTQQKKLNVTLCCAENLPFVISAVTVNVMVPTMATNTKTSLSQIL
jgi:hypothetical protein